MAVKSSLLCKKRGGETVSVRLSQIVLTICLLGILCACAQTPFVAIPTSTVGVEVELAPIMPIYFSLRRTDAHPNTLQAIFQSECYDNQESPRRIGYNMHLISSTQFELDAGLQEDKQCAAQRHAYDIRFSELQRLLTHFSLEDETADDALVLRGTNPASGEEIITRWVR